MYSTILCLLDSASEHIWVSQVHYFFSPFSPVFLIGYFLTTCLPGHQKVHQFGFTYTDILTIILPINVFSYFVFFNSRISIYIFSLHMVTAVMKLKDACSLEEKL